MTLQNIPSVMDLIGDADGIPELDLETIGLLIEDAKALSAKATKVSRALQEEVEARLKDEIRSAYAEKKADTGTVNLNQGDLVVEVTKPKKVDWDQDALIAIADKIRDAGDQPSEYIDVSMSVSEKRYVAWPAAIQKQFEGARTVTPGNISIKIKAAS